MSSVPRTPGEYCLWWREQRPDIPYGECWCGCGQETSVSRTNYAPYGHIKGEPRRYILGHSPGRKGIRNQTIRAEYYEVWQRERPDIPYGLCWCGCRKRTKISSETNRKHRRVEGEPTRYLKGHSGRKPIGYTVDKETGCWNWTGRKSGTTGGHYGIIVRDGTPIGAHRFYYEKYVGPIPPGHEVHHRCHNTICVNPDHVEALSPPEHRRLARSHKLTMEDARAIRKLLSEGMTGRQVAEMFSISSAHVSGIHNGRFWRDV